MFEKYHITDCKALENYKVHISFADGVSGIVNLEHLAGQGIFKIWDDYNNFKQVYIDPESKTICWNKDIDLDPINLRNHLK